MAITARNTAPALPRGARGPQPTPRLTHASAAAQVASVRSSTASRLLIACHGSRTSGFVISNGASVANRNTPAAAITLVMRAPEASSKNLATPHGMAAEGWGQGTLAAYERGGCGLLPFRAVRSRPAGE